MGAVGVLMKKYNNKIITINGEIQGKQKKNYWHPKAERKIYLCGNHAAIPVRPLEIKCLTLRKRCRKL